MSVGKITEITAKSPEGFEHAIKVGLERARKTVDNIQGAWIKDFKISFENGKPTYMVHMKLTFVLND